MTHVVVVVVGGVGSLPSVIFGLRSLVSVSDLGGPQTRRHQESVLDRRPLLNQLCHVSLPSCI